MTQTKEKKLAGSPENAYDLFVDLFTAFRESKVMTTGMNNKAFAFDAMCGIAEFTSAVLRAMGRASKESEDRIFEFYRNELLPSSYKLSDDLFADLPLFDSDMITDTLN